MYCKTLVSLGLLLMAIGVTGCVDRPHFNKYNLKLHLNNFNAHSSNRELDVRYNTYAKECATGYPQSGIKLAKLYKETLDPNNPNYLYLQQYNFSLPFHYCAAALWDNAKEGTTISGASKTEMPREDYVLALEIIKDAKPHTKEHLLNIIYEFMQRNDAPSANHWTRELNVFCRNNITGSYELGKFLFDKEDTKRIGYNLVFDAASGHSADALALLETIPYRKYRQQDELLKAQYQKLITADTD